MSVQDCSLDHLYKMVQGNILNIREALAEIEKRRSCIFNLSEELWASADHPVTCLNPEKIFEIAEVKAENGKLYIRGMGMWIDSSLCKFYSEKEALILKEELDDKQG